MKKRIINFCGTYLSTGLLFTVIVSGVWVQPLTAAESEAFTGLKSAVHNVLSVLNSPEALGVKKKKIASIYNANFSFIKMAQNTLKSDWNKLKNDERKAFSEKYAKFVLSFYLDKIDKYDRNKIEFVGEDRKNEKTTVIKTLFEYQGKMAKVDYYMTEQNGKWKVYDFDIEGVKLSATYRSQFSKILKEKSFAGLSSEIDRLLKRYKN
jgi:phospholipid transport system substrate-binding protein